MIIYLKICLIKLIIIKNNTNISIFSYKQAAVTPVSLPQLSLLTLIVLFESIINYIILVENHNRHIDIQITSHTNSINNFFELVEYYSSQLSHFETITKITTHRQSNVASPRTSTSKLASPRTSVTRKAKKSNSNSKLGPKELLSGRPRANAMRLSNAIPV